jgi:hypothetical protein
MNSGAGDTTQLVPGYPIRTPWDHSSVDNSPRPIAASHVLHRLLVPRHPPSALDNLTTTIHANTHLRACRQRCSRPLCTTQPTTNPHPHHPTRQPSPPHGETRSGMRPGRAWRPTRAPKDPQPATERQPTGLFPQDPTGCSTAAASRTIGPFPTPPTPTTAGKTRPY